MTLSKKGRSHMHLNRKHALHISISVRSLVRLAAVGGLALACAAPAAAQPVGPPIEPDPHPPGFEVPAVFATGRDPYGLAMGDIDHDGLPDLAVVSKLDNSVSVYFNTGEWDPPTGGFHPPLVKQIVPGNCVACQPMEVALVDMNNDGSLDMVISRSGAGGADPGIAILLYVGDREFGAGILRDAPTGMERARGLIVADIDNDGKIDIAVAGRAQDQQQKLHPALGMLWGTGVGNLQFTPELFRVDDKEGVGWDLAVGFFNDAGSPVAKPDLVLTNWDSPWVHVFLDGREFTKQTYASRISRGIASDVLVYGTFVDLAISAELDDRFRWFLGDGAGGFEMDDEAYKTGKCPFGIALGNINFGRSADVVVANSEHDPNGDITVWTARGDGTFFGPYYFLVEIDPQNAPKTCQVLIGDFDLDGMNDVVTSNVFANNISVLINVLDLSGL